MLTVRLRYLARRLSWLLLLVTAGSHASSWLSSQPFHTLMLSQTERPFPGDVLISPEGATELVFASSDNAGQQFVIGSLSKQITAALLLRLVEQGRVNLTDRPEQYLPDLPEQWQGRITLGQMLNHTSGIIALNRPLAEQPGQFRYSNLGYDLLGQIIEKVGQRPYAEQAKALFYLCDMRHSFAPSQRHPVSAAARLAPGERERQDGKRVAVERPLPQASVPSGGIVSSTSDLAAWNRCLYQSDKVLADTGSMLNPTSQRPHRWGKLGYASGLQVAETDAGIEYSHSGYVPGYISTMTYYPEHKVTLVILENVSWYPGDMPRVFGIHDRIRNELIRQLASKPISKDFHGQP
ncbi:serine hydrolase domain-containing protein [Ferrimonas sp. YFM]|uniref:serine hydrolase domain-containing protein n=1 Tax=Ferrimonas sp. YFM TaxID=3028878 RepID=UPI002573D34E|nr:serine hydrolase domain-containing protein [Ferrimonas sp. YFM]BDY04482.1 serine hydrolase [Ferrimonas sp. YFM]